MHTAPNHHRHARQRPPGITRALLVLGALLVVVTIGFGGYATGTYVTGHSPAGSSITHAKVIQPGAPHARPPVTAPHASVPTAAQLHTLHVWHVLHVEHVAHVAWLHAHGFHVQTE